VADSTITLVILEGLPPGTGPLEAHVRAVRHAAIQDNCRRFRECPLIGDIVVATNDEGLVSLLSDYPCTIYPFQSEEYFHFGRLLTRIINENSCRKVFYMGGGAGLFLSHAEIHHICNGLAGNEGIFFTNNFFSSDFVAFSPASVVNSIDMPALDNLLAYLLREEGGLELRRLTPTWGTMFDIDTPADVMVLSMLPGVPPMTSIALGAEACDRSRLERLFALFADNRGELMIFGRLNPRVAVHMEEHVRCRLRIFSEERGMKARGRIERGEVSSIMAAFLGYGGLEKFMEIISSCSSGAVLDSRLIFAHFKKNVSRNDRFLSDRGDYNDIKDDFVRELTRLAVHASIPVVLGGHSLLSGGLWVLSETAAARMRSDERCR
jgi:hypothetical protein